MDGVVGRKGVYMVAATNRPDIIDPALVRCAASSLAITAQWLKQS